MRTVLPCQMPEHSSMGSGIAFFGIYLCPNTNTAYYDPHYLFCPQSAILSVAGMGCLLIVYQYTNAMLDLSNPGASIAFVLIPRRSQTLMRLLRLTLHPYPDSDMVFQICGVDFF